MGISIIYYYYIKSIYIVIITKDLVIYAIL